MTLSIVAASVMNFSGSCWPMQAYSSAAYRSFKTFIGELTAVAAGVYVGIQEVVPIVEGYDSKDPWKVAAQKHGVIVDALKSEQVVQSSVRLNLVSLYSGFDLFMADIRSAFHCLQGREWIQYDGDTPFDALARNVPFTTTVLRERLGSHRIATMDHYRLVRNAIAHPRPEALTASQKFYATNTSLLAAVKISYGMQSVPNEIGRLTFHDIKLLARVALDLAKVIDSVFDPGDTRLGQLLATKAVDRTKSPKRNLNALIGWLRTEHGVSVERAKRIAYTHPAMTHELDG
ncbi:hypothetical protein [Burkholderia gladioli]|uniref:hypothetical protein n=1 Tax=Burkholderia gladioli TaxID=28095 RepID=UPI00163F9E34|nr:hypothetical protein [Burkholderia gladioli]